MKQKNRKKINEVDTKQDLTSAKFKPEEVIERIKPLANSMIKGENIELVHLECQREPNGKILRFYIDKPGGVTLDDCVNINRQLSVMLDVYMEGDGAYNLEVSSPGIDRPLIKEEDYVRYKGSMVRIKTNVPINGRKNFKGLLLGFTEQKINMDVDGLKVAIPIENVAKARLAN